MSAFGHTLGIQMQSALRRASENQGAVGLEVCWRHGEALRQHYLELRCGRDLRASELLQQSLLLPIAVPLQVAQLAATCLGLILYGG